MKFIHVIFVVYLLFFEDVLSQRIISRPELLLESQQQNEPVAPRGRGRARFSVTPEFEQVQADYEKTARHESTQRSRVSAPSKRLLNNRRNYEVEEVLDDIPDNARKYATRPRVVTEMRFEASNAPRDTTLFVPSEAALESVSSTEGAAPSSSEDASKAGDQTTEQEMMAKELMKASTPEVKAEPIKPQRIRTAPTPEESAATKPRTRMRKRPAPSTINDSASVKEASSSRKDEYLRKQDINRNGKSPGLTSEAPAKRTDPEPQPQTVVLQQAVAQPARINNFRSGRRRGGSSDVAPQPEKEGQQDYRRSRGPSVFQDSQDLQPSRTRTGRKAVNTSRRIPSRTTNPDQVSSTTEQQVNRGRVEGRRGRTFSREPQQSQRLEEPAAKETSTFASRRRIPIRPTAAAVIVNNPATVRSRTTSSVGDSVKSETTTRSINRSRSRFNPTNIDEQKLEVLPLFEAEPKTVPQTNRQQSYNRRRGGKETTADSSQKKSRPRVVVTRKETVTEAAQPPTFKPTVKESVHSEVSEVISTRKVTRPKPRGTKKANETPALKAKSTEEIDESDNYPEPFKALLHKQQKQNDAKDGHETKSSRPRSAEDDASSDAVDGTVTARSAASPAVSSTHLAFAPDALASSTSATSDTEASPSSQSPSLAAGGGTVSSAPPAISPDENEVLPVVKPTALVRPTRRRFSLATKPPAQDATTKKPFVPSRKPTPPRPYKKYTTETLSVSVNSSTQRYHARFTSNGSSDLPATGLSNLDRPATYKRNFTTKSSQNVKSVVPRKAAQDRPERKQIPIKGNKIVDQQSNTPAPLKRHGVLSSTASRYSSRYRGGDLGARLHHNAHAHSRGTTVVPVYVPTVPSISTPSTTDVDWSVVDGDQWSDRDSS